MERRYFLKGLLIAAPAGTALIQLATPAESEILKIGSEAVLSPLTAAHGLQLAVEAIQQNMKVYVEVVPKQFRSIGYVTKLASSYPVDTFATYTGTVRAGQWGELTFGDYV